jgi:hypothetical protein
MELLKQLKEKGIVGVVITFDGAGDNGDIEGIYCYDKENKKVKAGELKEALFKLGEAIIDQHDDIDFNDDGCFGEIKLNVESGKIDIEINYRYVEYHRDYRDCKLEDYLKEETAAPDACGG